MNPKEYRIAYKSLQSSYEEQSKENTQLHNKVAALKRQLETPANNVAQYVGRVTMGVLAADPDLNVEICRINGGLTIRCRKYLLEGDWFVNSQIAHSNCEFSDCKSDILQAMIKHDIEQFLHDIQDEIKKLDSAPKDTKKDRS